MEFHEAANIFPMMTGDDYRALVDDIRANGQLEPIWLYDGKILDGRNRYAACLEIGIEPQYKIWTGSSPIAFVVSMNLARRHLTSSQRAVVALDIERKLADEAINNLRRSPGRPTDNKPFQIFEKVFPEATPIHAAEQAAQLVGTNRQYVSDAKRIAQEAPELLEQVRTGELTMPRAVQEMRRREVIAHLEAVEEQEAKAVEGVYDTIVIDPPWPMEKIERDERPNQTQFDYPVMSETELERLEIPAAEDCHVWLWTTHKHIPMAHRLLDAWGFRYVCTFVWHKPGGFQPFGLPQYNCEFAIYARRGSPRFIDLKAFSVCFDAPRGEHSEKPDAFYDMVRRVTAGRRLDMFNRRRIEGFYGWGKEAILCQH